jgi:hypothetical protein
MESTPQGGTVASLHRTAGNGAVRQLHERGALQAKLQVSHPNDRTEREAERVAEAVMERSASEATADATQRSERGTVQRMCSRCQRRARQGKPLNCEECEAALQRKPHRGGEGAVDGATQQRIRSVTSGGRPLPESARSFFEPRFGRDFGEVRVHTGPDADEAARSIDAEAFTTGSDIVFRSGAYEPETGQGKRLLAHELAHVVQSSTGRLNRQEESNAGGTQQQTQSTGCTTSQQKAFEAARKKAAIRAQVAASRVAGVVPPVPGRDTAGTARMRAEMLARRLFDERPNMDGVAEIVRRIRDVISTSSIQVNCPSGTDSLCGNLRRAYVVGGRPPIHLCPSFFNQSVDDQANTLVHEAAHLVGIGEPEGEMYCGFFDCETSCGGFDTADAWAHYIHCLSGQPPQEPDTVTGGGSETAPGAE